MIDLLPRPLLLRLGVACVLLLVAWATLVRPAHARFDADRARLDIQLQQVRTHAASATEQSDLASTADAIRGIAQRLGSDLRHHKSSKDLLAQIETLAKANAVRINRSETFETDRVPVLSAEGEEQLTLFADRLGIAFTGSYSDASRFVQAIQSDIGIVALESIRLAPVGGQDITGSIEIKGFRLNPKHAGPFSAEAPDDEH